MITEVAESMQHYECTDGELIQGDFFVQAVPAVQLLVVYRVSKNRKLENIYHLSDVNVHKCA